MTWNQKGWYRVILVGWLILGTTAGVGAANISDFLKLSPYIEVESSYDDNVFEISENTPLPQDAKKREDLSWNVRAGVGADITLERPYLTLGVGLNYAFEYIKYVDNTELDETRNNLDFKLNFASKYEEGIVRDRLKVKIKDVLSVIPIDEEEPLNLGNRVLRNDFEIGADYRLFSTRRVTFLLGYAYGRVDFGNSAIDVPTVTGYTHSNELTQESQTHTGKADFKFILNPRITSVMTYNYAYVNREETSGELVSADFSRQNLLGGFQAQLSPRIQGNFQAGYGWTRYKDVGALSQGDQNDFIAESSITANFSNQPLITLGYRRYFTENDFGDTLLTGNVFGRVGFKVATGLLVNFAGDYIREDRSLLDDNTTQRIFGVNTEYALLKNIKLLAGYDYKKRAFFAHNFLADQDREETSQVLSGGVEYKVGRYILLKGMYSYTEKTSDLADQEFNRNKFTASGKVIF